MLSYLISKNPVKNIRCFGSLIDVSKDVVKALNEKRPIVALESTIITHGMPPPKNIETALEVEEIIKQNDAIPATISIIDGRIKVGMNKDDFKALSSKEAVKCSRRDIPYVMASGKTGGTTVSGTAIIANKMGIQIFATGGIGGVHVHGEDTLDISADLTELSRTPIAVVCSGVKSILDIPRTLEVLETFGVCVTTYGDANGRFPDFFTRDSGCRVPYNLNGPHEAAKLIKTLHELELGSGVLIAVPIPEEYALNKLEISTAIQEAIIDSERRGIRGKETTPFLLEAVVKLTKGNSLEANMALIKNNALVAARIANELYGWKKNSVKQQKIESKSAPFVIGASILDLSLTMYNKFPQTLNGETHEVESRQSAGGVGRNLADGISKLYGNVNFLSAVGNDELGKNLLRLMPESLRSGVITNEKESTSLCSVIFDKDGDCKLILGNMGIHQSITPAIVMKNEQTLSSSPLVIMDSNLSIETMECILKLSNKYKRPVFFEPTDMLIAGKPFKLPKNLTKNIKIITPNLYELKTIVETITGKPLNVNVSSKAETSVVLQHAKEMLKRVDNYFDCIVLTLGHHGAVVSILSDFEQKPLFDVDTGAYLVDENAASRKHVSTFFEAPYVDKISNVSGAGDSFSSGFVTGLLKGYTTERCANLGFMAAECALKATSAVPESYKLVERHTESQLNACKQLKI